MCRIYYCTFFILNDNNLFFKYAYNTNTAMLFIMKNYALII